MITSKEHTDTLFESFCKNKEIEKDMFIIEGLIIDRPHKKVRLTDEHDKGIDFNNEKYLSYKHRFNGMLIDVISIFKRTDLQVKYEDLDGNPFIYALKNQNNNPNEWRFDITDEEVYRYIRRFLTICKSIDKEYDTIIMVPSSHSINRRFMDVIFKQVKATNKVEDMFYKTRKVDAYNSRDLAAIEKYALKKCNHNYMTAMNLEEKIIDRIEDCFDSMSGNYFKASQMDKEYIRFIRRIVTPNNKYTLEKASELIRGKRVLVLDDTLSTGVTISSCVENIQRYGPSKLQVITLLSKKMKSDKL